MSSTKVLQIRDLHAVGSFPGSLLRVLDAVNHEETTKESLARVIEGDPDLAQKVIAAANSPLYMTLNGTKAPSGKQVQNLPTAVLRIGFAGIRNIAFMQGLCAMVSGTHEFGVSILAHLLVVGEIARGLGMRRSRPLGEEAYFVGIMHDFGKLALLRSLETDYLEIARICRQRSMPALTAEHTLLKPRQPHLIDHVCTAVALFRAQKMPDGIIRVVEHHHDEPARLVRSGSVWSGPAFLTAADHLAYHLGCGDGYGAPPDGQLGIDELAQALEIGPEELKGMAEHAADRAVESIAAARLPLTPDLLRRIAAAQGAADTRTALGRMGEEVDGSLRNDACRILVDLARSRPKIGFHEFQIRTQMNLPTLQLCIDRLVRDGYMRVNRSDASRIWFESTAAMGSADPGDLARKLWSGLGDGRVA
jgi:HD-like signal output (HDOD) protein